MSNRLIRMVKIPAGAWTRVMSKGKGHLLKIGPFEEWVPKRVVELAEDGTLFMSAAYLTPGRLWTSILKSYPIVKRPAAETAMGGLGGQWDDDEDDDDDIEIMVSVVKPQVAPPPKKAPPPPGATVKKKPLKHAQRKAKQVGKRRQPNPKPESGAS